MDSLQRGKDDLFGPTQLSANGTDSWGVQGRKPKPANFVIYLL